MSEYHIQVRNRDGYYNYCKSCHRQMVNKRHHETKVLNPKPAWRMQEEKACITCLEIKAADEFYRVGPQKQYLQSECITCFNLGTRLRYKKDPQKRIRETGISQRQRKLLAGGRTTEPTECEICGAEAYSERNGRHQNGNFKRLAFDHDHTTGEFRGWLCSKCNVGIGHFEDDPNLLLLAGMYLERFHQKNEIRSDADRDRLVTK